MYQLERNAWPMDPGYQKNAAMSFADVSEEVYVEARCVKDFVTEINAPVKVFKSFRIQIKNKQNYCTRKKIIKLHQTIMTKFKTDEKCTVKFLKNIDLNY